MLQWIKVNRVWLGAASVVMFVGALVLVPVVVVRLPADYFAPTKRDPRRYPWRHPALRVGWLVGKNVVGVLLVLAGVAMLILPGQGILTILIGITLTDFPGKYRLERWIVGLRPVLGAVNGIRVRFGRGRLELGEGRLKPREREPR